MGKGSYFLMEDRELRIKTTIVQMALDKSIIEDLYENEPFVCQLIINEFKDFLTNKYFNAFERKISLFKFLKNNYPLDLSRDVVEFVTNSSFADDYRVVIMEWNYQASDFIKQSALLEYNDPILALDYNEKQCYDDQQSQIQDRLNMVNEITQLFLESSQDDNPEN